MTWATIIAMILEIVGPYLMGWLKTWLESHLHKVAARLPVPATFGTVSPTAAENNAAIGLLLDHAETALPLFAFLRRLLIHHVQSLAEAKASGSKAKFDRAVSGLKNVVAMTTHHQEEFALAA